MPVNRLWVWSCCIQEFNGVQALPNDSGGHRVRSLGASHCHPVGLGTPKFLNSHLWMITCATDVILFHPGIIYVKYQSSLIIIHLVMVVDDSKRFNRVFNTWLWMDRIMINNGYNHGQPWLIMVSDWLIKKIGYSSVPDELINQLMNRWNHGQQWFMVPTWLEVDHFFGWLDCTASPPAPLHPSGRRCCGSGDACVWSLWGNVEPAGFAVEWFMYSLVSDYIMQDNHTMIIHSSNSLVIIPHHCGWWLSFIHHDTERLHIVEPFLLASLIIKSSC